MENSKGVSLIALIITIIVIIILAAIVLSSGGDTTNKAQLAVYVNNMSQYADRVAMDSLSLKQTLGINQENVSDPQLYYMTANGLKNSKDINVFGFTTPVGYLMPDSLMQIYGYSVAPRRNVSIFDSVAYAKLDPGDSNDPTFYIVDSYEKPPVVAYVIDDYNVSGYSAMPNNEDGSAGYEFYGDTNGLEYHFITSTGHVFSLPGFGVTQEDGSISFYISNEKGAYYVVSGQSGLAKGASNVNGDIVNELRPVLASDLVAGGLWGITSDLFDQTWYIYGTSDCNLGTEGRHTGIGEVSNWSGGSGTDK